MFLFLLSLHISVLFVFAYFIFEAHKADKWHRVIPIHDEFLLYRHFWSLWFDYLFIWALSLTICMVLLIAHFICKWWWNDRIRVVKLQKLSQNDLIKGQLISEWNFGVFKNPKKPTKFLADFCPMFGQKSLKNLVGFFLEIWRHQNFIPRLTDF